MTIEQPLVSVIIPLYNHEKYVIACLESIAFDGYDNKEIIILDDGSTDNSYEIARLWIEDKKLPINIQLFRQTNQGISATLNHLIPHCHGKYIRPIASDDCFIPGMLAQQVAFMEQHANYIASFADAKVIDERGIETSPSVLKAINQHHVDDFEDPKKLAKLLMMKGKVVPQVLIQAQFYQAFRYPGTGIVDDIYLFLNLAAHGNLHYFDKTVALYRMHRSNTSTKFSLHEPLARLKSRRKLIVDELRTLAQCKSQFAMNMLPYVYVGYLKKSLKIMILQTLIIYKKYFYPVRNSS